VSIIIQKFGGKLLETPEHIRRAARLILKTKAAGDDPVVVVSAPGSTTDRFLELAHQVADEPDERELDMLLSVGERTAMALLAMAINADGRYRAVSFTGSQIGIITDTQHTDARILEVKCLRIRETLERGEIPIVAGFQGVSTEREITTLGRGGSDATAVAIAKALGAVRCELIKESGAVYSADPELVPEAVHIPQIDYDTLEQLTSAGAQVVQSRAASLAKEHGVTLSIKGPEGNQGTLVTDNSLEIGAVASVIMDDNLSLISFRSDAEIPVAEDILHFGIWYNTSNILVVRKRPNIEKSTAVAMISVNGSGGNLSLLVIETSLAALNQAGISVLAASLSCGRYSVLINQKDGKTGLRAVHQACLEKGYIKTAKFHHEKRI